MTKLNFAFLHFWSALAFATASKSQFNRFHGEWIKLALRMAQQPLPLDLDRVLYAFDPDGRWLHAAAAMAA